MQREINLKSLDETKTLSGSNAREFATRGRETFKVPFESVRIRKGWNIRTDYGDLKALSDSLETHGQLDPIKGDLLEDGTFVPSDGHRRLRAIEMLRAKGVEFPQVLVMLNPAKTSDEQRLIQMWTANDSKPLEPIERAELCKRLVEQFKYTSTVIAAKLGISRMQVDNYLTLAGLSIEEKQAVKDGIIKPTAAVKLKKSGKSESERKTAIKSARSTGKKIKEKDIAKPKANIKLGTAVTLCDEATAAAKKLKGMTAITPEQKLIDTIIKRLADIKKIIK